MRTEVDDITEIIARRCMWCRRTVVPLDGDNQLMVEITHKPVTMRQRIIERICIDCYAKLIKLIADQRP